jgi:hypothetical protein
MELFRGGRGLGGGLRWGNGNRIKAVRGFVDGDGGSEPGGAFFGGGLVIDEGVKGRDRCVAFLEQRREGKDRKAVSDLGHGAVKCVFVAAGAGWAAIAVIAAEGFAVAGDAAAAVLVLIDVGALGEHGISSGAKKKARGRRTFFVFSI